MRRKYFSTFVSVSLFMMFLAMPVYAVVTGIVTDTTGYPVSGAHITFVDETNTDNQFSDYTDNQGHYEIDISRETGVITYTPSTFSLGQNYPNPFNPTTTIPFFLNKPHNVKIDVFNITGQRIRTLVNEYRSAGSHTVVWDAIDENGHHVSAGIYMYQLQADGKRESKKMLLLDGGAGTTSIGSVIAPAPNGTVKPAAKVSKTSSTTWKVEIKSDEIETYTELGLILIDGERYNFVVSRKPPPIDQYYVPGEVVVGFADSLNYTFINSFVTSLNLTPIDIAADSSFSVWIQVDSGQVSDHITRLEADSAVAWAQQRGYPFDDRDTQKAYIIARFRGTVSETYAIALIENIHGLTWKSTLFSPRWAVIAVPIGHEQQWIDILEQYPCVQYAELNYISVGF